MSEGRSDQRQQLRFLVGDNDDLLGLIDTAGTRSCAGVADLSLGGAGLVLPDPSQLDSRRPLHLALLRDHDLLGESDVELVHLPRSSDHGVVGVRFRQHDEPLLRGLCRYLVENHAHEEDSLEIVSRLQDAEFRPVGDRRRPRRLFKAAIDHGLALTLLNAAGARLASFHPRTLSGQQVVGELIDERVPQDAAPAYLIWPAHTALHLLEVRLVSRDGCTVTLEPTEQVFEGGSRRLCRVPISADDAPLLEFVHPHVPGKLVNKRLTEIGIGGMRIKLDIDEDLLAPGSLVDAAVLRLPGGVSIPCRCAVRHTVRHNAGHYSCGLQLEHFTTSGRRQWVRHVLDVAHPSVEEATPETLGEVWEVFERSGYLDEKPHQVMAPLKEPFIDTWRELIRADSGNRCWIFRDQGEAVGTFANSRVYSRTWLMHQLAADLFHFERKAQNVRVIAELAPRTAGQWHAGVHGEDYVLTFHDNDKSFNKWSWFDFFERHQGSGHLYSQKLRVREYQLEGLPPSPIGPDVWVRPARSDEMQWVADELARRDDPLLCQAFDYDADRLTLAGLQGGAEGHALRRERMVLVAGYGERAAIALCECGAPGTNIFALYNTLRILIAGRPFDDARDAALRDSLLVRAWRFFAQRAIPSFLYFTGDDDAPPPADEGGFEADAVRTILTGSLLTRWTESIDANWILG